MSNDAVNTCSLCCREVGQVSWHHLVPREEGGRYSETVPLCQPCHSTVHLLIPNRELARQYNTIDTLKNAAPLQKYLKWVKNKPIEKIRNRRGRK